MLIFCNQKKLNVTIISEMHQFYNKMSKSHNRRTFPPLSICVLCVRLLLQTGRLVLRSGRLSAGRGDAGLPWPRRTEPPCCHPQRAGLLVFPGWVRTTQNPDEPFDGQVNQSLMFPLWCPGISRRQLATSLRPSSMTPPPPSTIRTA